MASFLVPRKVISQVAVSQVAVEVEEIAADEESEFDDEMAAYKRPEWQDDNPSFNMSLRYMMWFGPFSKVDVRWILLSEREKLIIMLDILLWRKKHPGILCKIGSAMINQYNSRCTKRVDGLEKRYTSGYYTVCGLFDTSEAERLVDANYDSDMKGATAEGFAIHFARSIGLGVNVRREQPGSFGRSATARRWSEENPGGLYIVPVVKNITTQLEFHTAHETWAKEHKETGKQKEKNEKYDAMAERWSKNKTARKDKQLHRWMTHQRDAYNKDRSGFRLTEYQLKKLTDIGFHFVEEIVRDVAIQCIHCHKVRMVWREQKNIVCCGKRQSTPFGRKKRRV